MAIRVCVNEFRSDRGKNYVDYTKDLQKDRLKHEVLLQQGYSMAVQPSTLFPHGWIVRARMIRTVRSILDSMLSEVSEKKLTHEVLATFMCEVCAIVNA